MEWIPTYLEPFGVPGQFVPIGGISVGYSDEPPRNLGHLRKPTADTVHKGAATWPACYGSAAAAMAIPQ